MSKRKPAFTTLPLIGPIHCNATRARHLGILFKPIVRAATHARYRHSRHSKVSASADLPLETVEPILEGDLVAYRIRANPAWSIGAVIHAPTEDHYHVRSLYSRPPAENGTLECFVDWEPDSSELAIAPDTYEIMIVNADYEERAVQNRRENPHGEVSEDCWHISTQLLRSLGVSIRGHDMV